MSLVKFSDVVQRANTKEDKDNTDKIYYVGGEHIDSNNVLITERGIIKGSTIGPMFYFGFKAGQVLFVSRNPHLRKAGMVTFDGICSEKTFVLETKDENILLQRFLPFVMQSNHFWNYMEAHKSGSVNYFINWSTLANYEFELPDIDEQKRLTELLWAIKDTKYAYEKLISSIDEVVKSQFIEMFGVAESNSKGLNQCNMEDICEGITDGSHTPPKGIDHSEYLMLSSKNIINDCITVDEPRYLSEEQFESENKRTRIKAGDVLLTIVGTVGRTAVVPEEHPNMTLQRSVCVLHPKTDVILSKFLFYELKCMQDYIDSLAQGAAQRGIYLGQVSKLQVVVPPIENQKRFVSILEQSDKSKFEIKQCIETTEKLLHRIIDESIN